MQNHKIDGFAVTLYQDTVTGKNWVLIAVIEDYNPTVPEMTFVGIPPAKCLELAKHFDFNAMTKVVCTISSTGHEPGSGMPLGL